MRVSFRTPVITALAVLWALGATSLAGQNSDDEAARIRRVEQGLIVPVRVRGTLPVRFDIHERMAHYGVPGVSVAVIDHGRLAWAKGYGITDRIAGDPVTKKTLFQAASISKPVAALAALRLVERGVLSLDAPVNRYLRRWRIADTPVAEGNAVTLRHLLGHSAGLTVHGFPGYPHGAPLPGVVEVLDGMQFVNTPPVRLDTLPGTVWRYSGGGYTVLQLLLEDVLGKPFPDLMRELVLDPIGMKSSTFEQPLPTELSMFAARGHEREGARILSGWHDYPEMAAAGLWTTPSDLARLAIELQRALRGEEGRILSPAMAREMMTSGRGGWGLGFKIEGEEGARTFSHGGSNHGYKAQFLAFIEGGMGAIIMTNGDNGSPLAREILLSLATEYGWPGIEQEVREPGKGLDPATSHVP